MSLLSGLATKEPLTSCVGRIRGDRGDLAIGAYVQSSGALHIRRLGTGLASILSFKCEPESIANLGFVILVENLGGFCGLAASRERTDYGGWKTLQWWIGCCVLEWGYRVALLAAVR